LWTANGVSVCSNFGYQGQVALTPSSGTSAILSWTDIRNYPGDIYAMRLYTGGLLDVPAASTHEVQLESLSANPGRGEARFALHLARAAGVSAEVFDLLGRKVRTLQPSTRLDAGRHELRWDLTSDHGAAMRSGLYFVRVQAGGEVREAKWVSLR
jgi:hypothetical protein